MTSPFCAALPRCSIATAMALAFTVFFASAVRAQPSPETDLVGIWSGIDADGDVVTHVFEADGSASIHRNGEPQLEGGEAMAVRWSVVWRADGLGELDIVISMAEGPPRDVVLRFLAGRTAAGDLRLRSPGPSPLRPEALTPDDDALQITLSRG